MKTNKKLKKTLGYVWGVRSLYDEGHIMSPGLGSESLKIPITKKEAVAYKTGQKKWNDVWQKSKLYKLVEV